MKTKTKPFTDLEKSIRQIIVGDPEAKLLVSGAPRIRGGVELVMGTMVPACPFCGCRAVMVTLDTEEMAMMAAIECFQCQAITTLLEMLGAWRWNGWGTMLRSGKR